MSIRSARPLLAALLIATASAGSAAGSSLWFDAEGRAIPGASEAVAVLAAAGEHGLEPQDYDARGLSARLERVPALTAAERAALDDDLTAALQRYLSDLQAGRIAPRSIHADFSVPAPKQADTVALLRDAVAAHRVGEALREATPRLPMYAGLRQALADYRALGDHPAWQAALPPVPGRKLVAGQAWAGMGSLAARLQALGDLPADAALPPRYEGVLVDALKAFQERHGLAADGVLGVATLQALEVPPAQRARQIALAMERLRWTPFLQGPRMIVVNVPEFMLRAYEVRDGRVDVRLSMRVIVGKALDTRTPLFDEDMRFIEFSPYWNVPPSIARGEVIPKIRRSPGYFHDQGFEFVTGSGQVVTSLAPAHLDAVASGGWRVRQRPGPKNALGDIKFVFPNNGNIYLHHTPSPGLFERDRRDFSHGCIRVEAPVELAKFVLADEPAWTEARIREAMEAGTSRTIRLRQPLPVLIAYSTVLVKAGRPYFYADLYGHDKLLAQALQARSAGRPPLQRTGSPAQ